MSKLDRRQQKTKQALYDALLSCMQEKGLEHVTVTDLANAANINRGTFYLHYQDVRQMVKQIMDDKLDQFRIFLQAIDPIEHKKYNDQNIIYPKIIDVIDYISKDKPLYKIMMGPHGDPSYQQYFKDVLVEILSERFQLKLQHEQVALVPVHYLVQYMSSAVLGMILYWINQDLPEQPTELAAMITSIANHGIIVSAGLTTLKK